MAAICNNKFEYPNIRFEKLGSLQLFSPLPCPDYKKCYHTQYQKGKPCPDMKPYFIAKVALQRIGDLQ